MAVRRSLLAALLVLAALSGCGARVDSALRQRAADAQLRVGSSDGGAGGSGGPTGLFGPANAAGGGSNQSASGTASNAGSAPAVAAAGRGATGRIGSSALSGAAGGSGPAATVPPGGNGGATDVGVTANSISLGNVSDLSGPVPGLFQGALTGTLAYFNYVNSQGGIYGRHLKLDSSDSQTNCSQTQSNYSALIPKVFAFVGSFGLYDDCAANVLGQHTDVPAVEYMLSAQGLALPNDFSVGPLTPGGYPTGMFTYYASKFGSAAVQSAGTLYSNIPSAIAQAQGQLNAAQSQGWKFTYTRAIGATESNFTTDVVRMQQAGVKVVYMGAVTAQIVATFVSEAQQQNWNPIYVAPIAYAQNFLQLAGGNSVAEGIYGFQLYSMFFNQSDAQNIPEVALYQQWMHRTASGQPEDLYSMYGWASAALFTQALRSVGPHATRAAVMAALKTVHSYTDNGLVAPADPAGKGPTHCYVIWRIQSGQFVRQDTPPNDYRCDGTFYHP